ncbi:hypothetical protein [Paraglaciecola sp. MB-3u-78]|uniref:hypothetical protein n=1 Tax=Paraglaciecola sp. MB-3u-78 TaxID=2058332 RepID=UPI000C324A5D|nr:hypothetical protein [Paraglaciecola sp. MB-3u-78]PKG98577.1 hypothetical protein CXF95_11880 [Paraglaciecola sp. MB-3u-78]
METKDIADLFIAATGKIEFYWNFYTVTLLVLIGWLISTKKILRPGLKCLITVGYLVFALMNILGLWGSYTFAEALRQDLLIAAQSAPDTLKNAQTILSKSSFSKQKVSVLIIHGVLGVFVLSVIWFGRLGELREDNKN